MISRILTIIVLCMISFIDRHPAQAQVVVSTVAQLEAAVSNANAGGERVILLADGTYFLNNLLYITGDHITVQGQSGNRDAVILRGQGMDGGVSHVFLVRGSHFTVRDMTLGWVANHGIQIQGEQGASHVTMANLRIADCFEQLVKVSYNAASTNSSTHGVLEDSLLEYTAGVGPQYYIGGIDAHQARNWTVRRNIFRNIASPSVSLAEHAVHFWSGSEDTLVDANLIIDCDRGIGFGLGERGHVRGVIRNNMIFHSNRNNEFADVGIDLQSSTGAMVYNNTIFFEHGYPNAIEYRFAATSGTFIANNLTNKAITSRDGASGTLTHNVTTAQAGWFVAPSSGDLHLAFAVPTVVDRGTADIPGLPVPFLDFDGQQRPVGAGIDIGADEYGAGPGDSWHSEVGVINADTDQLQGVLRGFNSSGNQVWTRDVSISGYGRLELDIAHAAGDAASTIKSMRLDISSGSAVGYQKFYQAGKYRVGLEALPQANQNALYLPHIHSDSQWWTGVGLVNTTSAAKTLGFSFSDGVSAARSLGANSHDAFTIEAMRGNAPFVGSAQVPGGAGVAGLMLFGSERTLSGVSLSDATAHTLVFPHVDQNGWWTGIGIYNPNPVTTDLTVTGYDQSGGQTDVSTHALTSGGNMVFATSFSPTTAWFTVESTQPVTGFELFGTEDGNQLAGYSVVNLATATGVFPKLERDGWTGIAFVNPGAVPLRIELHARNNNGAIVAGSTIDLDAGSKAVSIAEHLFSGQDISTATYISFTATEHIVGFQLNGSADGTMLDAIPALGSWGNYGTTVLYFPHIHAD